MSTWEKFGASASTEETLCQIAFRENLSVYECGKQLEWVNHIFIILKRKVAVSSHSDKLTKYF